MVRRLLRVLRTWGVWVGGACGPGGTEAGGVTGGNEVLLKGMRVDSAEWAPWSEKISNWGTQWSIILVMLLKYQITDTQKKRSWNQIISCVVQWISDSTRQWTVTFTEIFYRSDPKASCYAESKFNLHYVNRLNSARVTEASEHLDDIGPLYTALKNIWVILSVFKLKVTFLHYVTATKRTYWVTP